MQTTLSKNKSAIALKGGMFTLTTIQLFDADLDEISEALDKKINQAPNFFQYAPIILDLQHVAADNRLDLAALNTLLRTKKLIPIGVRGASKSQKQTAINIGLALFPEEKIIANKQKSARTQTASQEQSQTEIQTEIQTDAPSGTPTRLITQPVRSGQQIYVPGGDLIVIGAVSHGAELLADGHIHVYGSMRGRALAGVMGDTEAMIFCRSLEAELISIAGQYRLCEDLKETCWKQAATIQLQEGRLNVRAV